MPASCQTNLMRENWRGERKLRGVEMGGGGEGRGGGGEGLGLPVMD